jgi:hypothetical protein
VRHYSLGTTVSKWHTPANKNKGQQGKVGGAPLGRDSGLRVPSRTIHNL